MRKTRGAQREMKRKKESFLCFVFTGLIKKASVSFCFQVCRTKYVLECEAKSGGESSQYNQRNKSVSVWHANWNIKQAFKYFLCWVQRIPRLSISKRGKNTFEFNEPDGKLPVRLLKEISRFFLVVKLGERSSRHRQLIQPFRSFTLLKSWISADFF